MRLFYTAILCLLAVGAAAQERAPNRRDVVEQVSAADPARFACAHVESRSCKHDWITAVAAALHATDARWGLNGKRGNPDEVSMDVVTWRLGPTDRHVEAFDICGACGGGSPSVTWSNITNFQTLGQPGTAIWIKPGPVAPGSGGGGTPLPTSPSAATVQDLLPLKTQLETLTAKVDALAALLVTVRELADAARVSAANAAMDAQEVNVARVAGTLVPAPAAPGCLIGRVPKAFGGSSEVLFCPPKE